MACNIWIAGTLNDINIWNLSPLLEMILNGKLEELERQISNCVIMNEIFKQLCMLVDGICPLCNRFVKSKKEPIGELETALSKWQESARKDIERAFGVLQAKFQCLARPIVLRDPNRIENLVTTALILHNMCVSERIMGNPRDRYNPANSLVRTKDGDLNVAEAVDVPEDQEDVQSRHRSRSGAAKMGIKEVVELLTGRKRR